MCRVCRGNFVRPPKELTKRLVYKQLNPRFYSDISYKSGSTFFYNMVDTESKKILGVMATTPGKFDLSRGALYIDLLKVNQKNDNVGSEFLVLAEKESQKQGFSGRLYLDACKLQNENRSPHLFYKKKGFKSKSFLWNTIMNLYIMFNKEFLTVFAPILRMYKE